MSEMKNEISVVMGIVCLLVFIIAALATAYVEYQTSMNAPIPVMLGD